ncbi:MAG: DUF4359 domain-containing protein [Nitrospira sp.]|nr:DUF4359 domain-containing protein [Nitrospira sp.]
MSTRALTILTGLLGLCVALALTNPTTQDYSVFLEKQLGLAVERIDRTLPVQEREMLRGLYAANGKKLVELVVQQHTRRRNFGLFSLFESRVLEQRVMVIGIASTFVPVEGVEEAIMKIGQLVTTLKR